MPNPFYIPTFSEKLAAFLTGLRIRLFPKDVLVVGPYTGEFGIEIIKFQSFVRALAPHYKTVHVITYPGREPLYRAPNVTVHAHEMDLKTAGYWYGNRSFQTLENMARQFAREQEIQNYDLFNTNLLCTGWHRKLLWRQKHVPLQSRSPAEEGRYDVLFHFRAIDKAGPDQSRNYRPELAEQLVQLCLKENLRCACIGHPDWALCFDGCADRRTENLDETIATIQSGRLLAGELSGPIHLAIFCAKPVVTWAPEPHRIAYAKKHNPFQVGIAVVTDRSTHPEATEVFRTVRDMLRIGR
jgi:hypothetical protein